MLDPVHSLSLETILIFSRDKMQQLLNLLQKEAKVLENNNIDELEAITKEKITLTEQIEKNEQQRIHFLTAKSLNAAEPSEWLGNNKLITIWRKIKELSEQAQKQNQVNGQVIFGNRRRLKTQLEILSSSTPATELTYSATGENVNQHNSNTLARA
jgi:flagellar biosynthesis/type III secretory pathway chaperone